MPTFAKGSFLLIFVGSCLVLIGALFTFLMGKSYLHAREMRTWPKTEATILSSDIEEWSHDPFSPLQFRLTILYGYEYQGKSMTSQRLSARGNPWTNKRNAIEEQLRNYPIGATRIAYLHPHDPSFAILKLDSLAPGYSIWFPLLFVIGGIGIITKSIRMTSFTKPCP